MQGLFSTFVFFCLLSSCYSSLFQRDVFISRRGGRNLHQNEADSTLMSSCNFQGPFPYVVSVRGVHGGHRCGGTLISPTAVLTAASCVDSRAGLSNVTMYPKLFIGGVRTEDPLDIRQTCDVSFAPGWNGNRLESPDLAVLTFSKASCVNPIPSIGNGFGQGALFLVGNGREGEGDAPFNEFKSIANVTELFYEACAFGFGATLRNKEERCLFSPSCFCASACEGDEGASIVAINDFSQFSDRLAAVVSRSEGPCASPKSVAIATNLDFHKAWIERAISEAKCQDSGH